MNDITNRINTILINRLEINENELVPEAKLLNDLGADELDTIEIIIEIEKEFEISISDEDASNITTYGDLVQYISDLLGIQQTDSTKENINIKNEDIVNNLRSKPLNILQLIDSYKDKLKHNNVFFRENSFSHVDERIRKNILSLHNIKDISEVLLIFYKDEYREAGWFSDSSSKFYSTIFTYEKVSSVLKDTKDKTFLKSEFYWKDIEIVKYIKNVGDYFGSLTFFLKTKSRSENISSYWFGDLPSNSPRFDAIAELITKLSKSTLETTQTIVLPDKIDDYKTQIEKAKSQNDWENIITICEQHSDNPDLLPFNYFYKALSYYNLNKQAESVRFFQICKDTFNEKFGGIANKQNWNNALTELFYQITLYDAKLNELNHNFYNALWKYNECLNLVTNIETKYDIKEKRDKLYLNFVQNIDNINFDNRKVLLFADDFPSIKTPNILPLISNNYGNLKFPPNHPKKGELYLGHPFRPNVYFPIESAEFLLFESQVMELTKILGKIGARKIEIEHLKGESNNIIQNLQKNITQQNTNNSSLGVNLRVHSANVSSERSNNSNSNTDSHIEQHSQNNKKISVVINFDKPQTIERPNENEYIWYSHNESWQDIVYQRFNNGVIDYTLLISSKQSEVLSEREFESIQNEYKSLIQIGYKNLFFKANIEVQNSNNNTSESSFDSKFKKMQSTEWKIYVEFEPFSNISVLQQEQIHQSNTNQFSENEQDYLEFLETALEDGIITDDERKMLEKRRIKLGLSDESAKRLEEILKNKNNFTEQELEYMDMLKDCFDDFNISPDERKILNKFKLKFQISDTRAIEIENELINKLKLQ